MNVKNTKNWRVRATGIPARPYVFEMIESAKPAAPFNRVASTWWNLHIAGFNPEVVRPRG